MEVILKEEVAGVGKAGELVKVKSGFARNYLLPQKKAVPADAKNIKMMEHHKKVIEAQQAKAKKVAEDLAAKISAIQITIAREAGEEEKIFGSVTAKDIAEALRKDGITIDKRYIQLKESIKTIGIFDINVKLHQEVTAALKLWVVKK